MPARLSHRHFALYRGYLDGLPIEALHRAYGEGDLRTTRRRIATLADTLTAAARRIGDIEAARLLRLPPLAAATDAPALETYRAHTDPHGVYSEAELLALYQADYPLERKAARLIRLRTRQASALERLERVLAEAPAPEHGLEGWLAPALASRLRAAGLVSIKDVLALIAQRRQRWHTMVPRLGPTGAARITDWLALHATSLGSLSPLATTPRRQLAVGALTRPATSIDIAPLESFIVPDELDGSQGTNRTSATPFANDLAAIHAWIAIRGARSTHTERAYRREAERLLLWATLVQHKPFSSLTTLDCHTYLHEFLIDPPKCWIGPPRIERFDPAWRPLAGPLTAGARERARKLLSALCAWLVAEQYLRANPFHGLPAIATPTLDVNRTLTHDQWRFVLQTVQPGSRDYIALLFAYATGLRRAELAAATTGSLARMRLNRTDAWILQVQGKGQRMRRVPLPPRLIEAIEASLAPLTLETVPIDTPLIAHLKTRTPLTPDALARLYKRIFIRAAHMLEVTRDAAELRRASTHWLRHTHANHALDAGADLRDVQAGLGHASLATTTLYTRADAARQYRTVENFFNAALDGSANLP